jgi:hypothetical protein
MTRWSIEPRYEATRKSCDSQDSPAILKHVPSVHTLKALGLMWEFGFMLFDPSSTFESIKENIGFLRQIVDDGSVAAVFCKMLPYDGTPN